MAVIAEVIVGIEESGSEHEVFNPRPRGMELPLEAHRTHRHKAVELSPRPMASSPTSQIRAVATR